MNLFITKLIFVRSGYQGEKLESKKMLELVEELAPLLNLPFAFFGHSMGSIISFELARYLRRQKALMPIHLFVSGSRAPHLPPRDQPFSELHDNEFFKQILNYNGIPDVILKEKEYLDLYLPILRADIKLIERYCYKKGNSLNCPITAFGGVSDPKVSQEEIAAWNEHTNHEFKMHLVSGNHFFIAESSKLILDIINSKLCSYL